jgi:hypothetical protein
MTRIQERVEQLGDAGGVHAISDCRLAIGDCKPDLPDTEGAAKIHH